MGNMAEVMEGAAAEACGCATCCEGCCCFGQDEGPGCCVSCLETCGLVACCEALGCMACCAMCCPCCCRSGQPKAQAYPGPPQMGPAMYPGGPVVMAPPQAMGMPQHVVYQY